MANRLLCIGRGHLTQEGALALGQQIGAAQGAIFQHIQHSDIAEAALHEVLVTPNLTDATRIAALKTASHTYRIRAETAQAQHASSKAKEFFAARQSCKSIAKIFQAVRAPFAPPLVRVAEKVEGHTIYHTLPVEVDKAVQKAWQPIYDGNVANPAQHFDYFQQEFGHHFFLSPPTALPPITGARFRHGMYTCEMFCRGA